MNLITSFYPHPDFFFLTCSQHLNFSTDYRDRLQNVSKVRHLNKNGSLGKVAALHPRFRVIESRRHTN